MGLYNIRHAEFPSLGANGPSIKLWLLAALFYGIGDLLTTIVGLSSGNLVEASPFVIPLFERFGLIALFGLKCLVFGVTGLLWWVTPYPESLGVPIGLAAMGLLVTGWNIHLLLIHGM